MPKNGFITPSGFKDLMTGGKAGEKYGATVAAYVEEIALGHFNIAEEEPQYIAKELQWGIDHEGIAEQAYQMQTFNSIQRISSDNWIQHKKYSFIGGHVDGGYVKNEHATRLKATGKKLVEIKCPYNPKNHYKNIKTAEQFKKQYKPQIQGYLWIAECDVLDAVSYDPRFKDINLDLYVFEVERDDAYISLLEERALEVWEMVQKEIQIIQELSERKPA